MRTRRSHYELAFERYLDRRGTPYVAVEDVRHFVKARIGVKAFDYVVYPLAGRPCLVDVKGRKCLKPTKAGECRQKNWVTRADVSGLQTWESVFGSQYTAVFAFAYWIADDGGAARPDRNPPFKPHLTIAGRRYSFWLVPVSEYAAYQRRLSPKWDTISIPRGVFRSISKPLSAMWPAAPC